MSGLDAQTVLATIPGWEGAAAQELSGGLSNRTWLVTSVQGRGVLKIDGQSREPPYNARPEEEIIQSRAAAAGLANSVLHSSETVYLTEYLEGEVWTREHLTDSAKLVELSRLLRQVHSLPLTGRHFDAARAAGKYEHAVPEPHKQQAKHCADIVRQLLAPQNLCCCHNDVVAGNIIATPALRLLDWEYACDNDPLFDLATVIAHHKLPESSAELLLDAYFDGVGARWKPQFEQQIRLYNALLWLWSACRPDAERERLQTIIERIL